MEGIVHKTVFERQFELVGVRVEHLLYLTFDKPTIKLLCRAVCGDVTCVKVNFVSCSVRWRWGSIGVCRVLLSCLRRGEVSSKHF